MGGPKDFQQFFVGELRGVEINLDRFAVIAQAVISWIFFRAPGIAHASPYDTFDGPELGLDTPKSPKGEGRGLYFGRCSQVNGGPRSLRGWNILGGAIGFPHRLLVRIPVVHNSARIQKRTHSQAGESKAFQESPFA